MICLGWLHFYPQPISKAPTVRPVSAHNKGNRALRARNKNKHLGHPIPLFSSVWIIFCSWFLFFLLLYKKSVNNLLIEWVILDHILRSTAPTLHCVPFILQRNQASYYWELGTVRCRIFTSVSPYRRGRTWTFRITTCQYALLVVDFFCLKQTWELLTTHQY